MKIDFEGEGSAFEIINVMGQVVYSGNLNQSTKVQTSSLKSGVYMIQFFKDKTIVTKKFIRR